MTRHDVLWIVSYPKSGNTWIHSVLRRAGRRVGFPLGDLDVYNAIRSGEFPEPCPAVAADVSAGPCLVLKSHGVHRPGEPLHELPGREHADAACIHILRNPLDTLLSYLNFTRHEFRIAGDEPGYRERLFADLLGIPPVDADAWGDARLEDLPTAVLDHALDVFSDADLSIAQLQPMAGGWLENARSWLRRDDGVPVQTVRYEDCVRDGRRLGELSRFFTFGADDVSRALGFVNARAEVRAREGTPLQQVFHNRMSAGYYRDFFSAPALQRFFARHEASLREVGYGELVDVA